jgi:release factor glutamine methyltransferase
VNPYAVRCTKDNASLNNVRGKMAFVQGDLFMWLSEKAMFDVILFNAPYLPADDSEADSWIGRAWAGGASGRHVIDRFISVVPKYLKRMGRVLLMQSNLANINETVDRFAEYHLNAEVVADCALPFFETVVLIEARL